MRDCGCINGSHWSLLKAVVAASMTNAWMKSRPALSWGVRGARLSQLREG